MAWTVCFTWLFYALSALDEALDPIRGERDENIQRKSFSISEAVSVGRAIERLEKLAAQERQKAGRKRGGKARHENAHDREGDQSSLLENCQEAGRESTKLSGCEITRTSASAPGLPFASPCPRKSG